MKHALIPILAAFALAGCATTTTSDSTPAPATVTAQDVVAAMSPTDVSSFCQNLRVVEQAFPNTGDRLAEAAFANSYTPSDPAPAAQDVFDALKGQC